MLSPPLFRLFLFPFPFPRPKVRHALLGWDRTMNQ